MSISRWEPFGGLMSLREAMDRLFEDSLVRPSRLFPDLWGESLAVDVYQTDNEVVVKTTLPGVKPDEVEITVTGDTLTIKGETKAEEKVKRENYFRQERRCGAFSRSVTIPIAVRSEKAEATFQDGVLTITLPKAEEAKPKRIKIQAQPVIEDTKKRIRLPSAGRFE